MFENIAWDFQSALPLMNRMALDKVPYFMKFKPPLNVRYVSILCATQKNKTKLPVIFIKYTGSKTQPDFGDIKM